MKTIGENIKSNEVKVVAPDGTIVGRFVSSDTPLSCGARAWFEMDTNSGYTVQT